MLRACGGRPLPTPRALHVCARSRPSTHAACAHRRGCARPPPSSSSKPPRRAKAARAPPVRRIGRPFVAGEDRATSDRPEVKRPGPQGVESNRFYPRVAEPAVRGPRERFRFRARRRRRAAGAARRHRARGGAERARLLTSLLMFSGQSVHWHDPIPRVSRPGPLHGQRPRRLLTQHTPAHHCRARRRAAQLSTLQQPRAA
ncbi:hypothetical protein EMIHUDRAFT_439424 [Emiliania huxleyi CCMP1516]|uniref:Uncharacterized protein n=2 Tax=Emiliania huxleyi TaxID=2903 RepID=A0A0D3KZ10_EMIH1|nr:hypothetical protein EMIHUDRAFT_439424 [Emiliania huxleyi CCMP1516]EOD40995.1 hypothetical protein EMIHUDRAFT_439424 [Emiliania huxleyi CCMP1516]|eukprot:XP_005793424.1 hypothetical protein EMIHUDRAFT_439424 [Emiliania huxleyi CCMP1516]